MTECYRCGQEGHRRADCPQAEPLPAPQSSGPAPKPPPVPPRIIRDPAIAHRGAQLARKRLGLHTDTDPGDNTT